MAQSPRTFQIEREENTGIVKYVVLILLLLFSAIIFFSTYFTVDPYQVGVLTRFGQIVEVAGPGLHFKTPFVNGVEFFRTDVQSLTSKQPANTYTVDNQEVDVTFTVFYRIPIEKVSYIYTNARDYQARLEALTLDRVKQVFGLYNTEHVAEKRGEIRDKIKGIISTDIAPFGLEVVDFQLTNLEYADSFRASIARAAVAKAEVSTREQQYQQALKEADTVRAKAKGEADARLYTAENEAKAVKIRGEAEAAAIEVKGKAEAAAIKAQSDALQQTPNLVELRKAERWDGKLPQSISTFGGNTTPFINIDQQGYRIGKQ